VGPVLATDPDANPRLKYELLSGNDAGAFSLDTDTGRLTIADRAALDFSATPVVLEVKVSDALDASLSATSFVTVQLQNLAPPTVNDQFTVNRNSISNVLDVLANDSPNPDPGEQLTIVSVSEISPEMGVLTLQLGKIVFTSAAGFSGDVQFDYLASDGSTTSQGQVTIHVVVPAFPWQNGSAPLDVNADGLVDIQDALAVIRHLRRNGSASLPVTFVPPPFVDVDGSNQADIQDALLIIRALRRGMR
jgi:hypothetical protein